MIRAVVALLTLSAIPAAAGEPVSGKYTGNGKEAKLAYVTAHKGEVLTDKPTTVLVFTEKDHSKDKRPVFTASFGDYGSALILTVLDDSGKVVGCQIAHQGHKKQGLNSIGSIATSDFKKADGKITGKIKSDGEVETFGEKWLVDLAFEAKAP
jgi:hypothetical protein